MKAVILKAMGPAERGRLELAELPMPAPKDDEVLIEVSACGLCHTDLDEIEGRLAPARLPIVLGHQVVGRVVDKRKAVTRHAIGDRVGVTWFHRSCGRCAFCGQGMENLCEQLLCTGKDVDGGYAEYMVAPEGSAFRIPERFSDSHAAPLLCAGVIGYRAVRLAQITDGQVVGLFGFGASAHIVIQILRHRYPESPVFVFSRGAEHRELAKELGATWVGGPMDSPPVRLARAIDFTPVGETIPHALGALDRGGRLVINAIRKTAPIPEMRYDELLWEEREIKSVANVTPRDAEEFLPLAAQVPIVPEVEELGIEQANDGILAIKRARVRAAAVLRVR